MRRLVVDGTSERWVGRGFPWVYPREVVSGGARPGEEVLIVDRRGRTLGRGLAEAGFLAARVMRHDGGPLDEGWLRSVLLRARALRDRVVDPDTDAYRLIHGENDGLPGVRVDRYGDWAVITLDGRGVDPLAQRIADWLAERGVAGIGLCYRPDPRDTGGHPGPRPLRGAVPGQVIAKERGVRFAVDPLDGPDVGLYPDLRPVRAWLEPHWAGRTLINLFAYTGAFTVCAAAKGAAATVSVDLSEGALQRARGNLALNAIDGSDHTFEADDVFRALDRHRRRGTRFDVAVIDPPSFSRGVARFAAKKDWPRLVAATARVLAPGGWLVVASNQGQLSPRAFDTAIEAGLRKAGRAGQLLLATGQGPDFPAITTFPEGRYLKVRIFAVP